MDIEILKIKDTGLKDVVISQFDTISVFEKFNHKFDEIFKDTYLYSNCGPIILTPLQRVVMTPEILAYINGIAMCTASLFNENNFNENNEIEKSISFKNWMKDLVFVNGGKYEKIPISHVVMNITTKLRTVQNNNGFGPNILADVEINVSVKYDKDRESSTTFDSFTDMIYG